MSLLFDTDEVSNFRDKLPPADFTEVAGLIKDGANLAGRMEESQNVQRIHLALLHELESFGTDVPLGIEALRQFADHVIGTYTGVDGDNADDVTVGHGGVDRIGAGARLGAGRAGLVLGGVIVRVTSCLRGRDACGAEDECAGDDAELAEHVHE